MLWLFSYYSNIFITKANLQQVGREGERMSANVVRGGGSREGDKCANEG